MKKENQITGSLQRLKQGNEEGMVLFHGDFFFPYNLRWCKGIQR
jgi:hypothetical protein